MAHERLLGDDPPQSAGSGAAVASCVTDIEGAKVCKQASYDIYQELNRLYQETKGSNEQSVLVSVQTLREMRSHAKTINRGITQFARGVALEMFRLGMELSALKEEMHGDILDREAAFTQTLETIGQNKEDALGASLASALKVVQASHSSMLSLKEDTVFESEAIEACRRARDTGA